MKSMTEVQEEIIEEFALLEEWMDRYELLIEMGNELEEFPETEKVEENLIQGCQSRVWITSETTPEGKMIFRASSDALIVKGLVALLLRIYQGQTPKEILSNQLYCIDKIGLTQHLSPTRSNGLVSMIERIKRLAALEINNTPNGL